MTTTNIVNGSLLHEGEGGGERRRAKAHKEEDISPASTPLGKMYYLWSRSERGGRGKAAPR